MLLKELTNILTEDTSQIGSKKHMAALVKKYNKIADKEHAAYMTRGRGGSRDWYNTRNQFEKEIKAVNMEFKKTFKKLIPKADYANFSLGAYDTNDVKAFVDEWFKNV